MCRTNRAMHGMNHTWWSTSCLCLKDAYIAFHSSVVQSCSVHFQWFCSSKPFKTTGTFRMLRTTCQLVEMVQGGPHGSRPRSKTLKFASLKFHCHDIGMTSLCLLCHLCLCLFVFSILFADLKCPTESRVATGSFGPTLNANHGIVQDEKKQAMTKYDEWTTNGYALWCTALLLMQLCIDIAF